MRLRNTYVRENDGHGANPSKTCTHADMHTPANTRTHTCTYPAHTPMGSSAPLLAPPNTQHTCAGVSGGIMAIGPIDRRCDHLFQPPIR